MKQTLKAPTTVALTLGLALGAALVGCAKKQELPEAPLPVLVTQVSADSAMNTAGYAAEIQPSDSVDLGFKVAGQLVSRQVEVGEQVAANQTLAYIDSKDYGLSTQALTNQVAAAKLDAEQKSTDAARFERLASLGSMAKADAERQRTAAQAAKAQLAQLQNQLSILKNQESDTKLKAPFEGVISAVYAEQGQVLAAGTPVVRLAKTSGMEVVAQLPAEAAQNLDQAVASAELFAAPDSSVALRLKELAPQANPVTKTFKATFSAPNGFPKSYQLGMNATLKLASAAQQNAAWLPAEAVLMQNNTPFVWLVEDQNPVKKPVTVLSYSSQGALVTGLSQGDLVVSAGAFKVKNGLKLKPVPRNQLQGSSKPKLESVTNLEEGA